MHWLEASRRREYLNNKKTKKPNSKMGKGPEQTHLQRHTNGQHVCEKMLTQRRYQEIQISILVRQRLVPTRWLQSQTGG